MNKKTFIVHGPRACGKTTNRKAIAQQLTGDANAFAEAVSGAIGMDVDLRIAQPDGEQGE